MTDLLIKLTQLRLQQMETDARLLSRVSINQIIFWLAVNSGVDQ